MSGKTARIAAPLRCPKCSNVLVVGQLMAEDKCCSETIFLMDCPRGDFHIAVTDKEVVAVVASIVMEHLNRGTSPELPSAG